MSMACSIKSKLLPLYETPPTSPVHNASGWLGDLCETDLVYKYRSRGTGI